MLFRFSGCSRAEKPLVQAMIAALAIAWCGSAVWAEVILFDNLAAGSPNGEYFVSNTQLAAQAFTTTATDAVLSEVSLRFRNLNGTSGEYQIQIWDSSGSSGSPGNQVGAAIYTGLAENLGSSTSLLTIPGLSVALGASTTYYLVATGTSLTVVGTPPFTSDGNLAWGATDVVTSGAYSNGGAGWSGPSTQSLYMKVSAVPEPVPATIVTVGLAAGWMRSRRRKARHVT
ncbi:MAG: hypothetical protein RLZZ440_372 [Planctomycetota bacterium]|jgi:hypothetical protein